jgi:hypothetical protein
MLEVECILQTSHSKMNKSSHSLHPHRHISLSAPILTHKYTSISPNMHNTCTCTAVPHIASIQIAHHAFSCQNACDAPTTYVTHRIQLSIMVLGTVILSYCHKLYAAYYHTTRIRKRHITTTPLTYTNEQARTQTHSGYKLNTQDMTNTSPRLFAYTHLHKSRLLLDLSSKTVLTARRGTNTQTMMNSTKTSTIDINLSDQKLQGTTLDYNFNSTQTQFFALVDRHGN